MANSTASVYRSGQSFVPQDQACTHTLNVYVEDRPGSIDRVVGALRRRRANLQTMTLGRSEQENVMRIIATVIDSEVEVAHLTEQLRKIFDVRKVELIDPERVIVRELALVKVSSDKGNSGEFSEVARRSGAHVMAVAQDSVTFEVAGSSEKIDQFIDQMQQYGVREIARSGSVMIAQETVNK